MANLPRCGAADEIELAANEEQRKAKADPRNESAYYEAALILRRVARNHHNTCIRCQAEYEQVAA